MKSEVIPHDKKEPLPNYDRSQKWVIDNLWGQYVLAITSINKKWQKNNPNK